MSQTVVAIWSELQDREPAYALVAVFDRKVGSLMIRLQCPAAVLGPVPK